MFADMLLILWLPQFLSDSGLLINVTTGKFPKTMDTTQPVYCKAVTSFWFGHNSDKKWCNLLKSACDGQMLYTITYSENTRFYVVFYIANDGKSGHML